MNGARVVVVGGGLAGLACSVRLAASGAAVTLVEARPRLGGATYSFDRGGLSVDNGQHVFLRCYTEYQDFLGRINADSLVSLQDRFNVPVVSADSGRIDRLYRTRGLPAPLHLSTSLGRYHAIGLRDRMRVLRAVLRLRALEPQDAALDTRSFGDWLAEHGQSSACIEAMWDLLIVAALNSRCGDASLLLATKVLQTALLTYPSAADIGIPLVPLDELHARPAARALTAMGGQLHLRTKVEVIRPTGRGFEVGTDADALHADAVVLATPHQQAAQLLPPGAVPELGRVSGLGAAPIVNVHLLFDRPVTDLPFAAVLKSPLQWIFDRTEIAGLSGDGQYLAVSLSAAEQYIDLPTAELREWLHPEIVRLFPLAATARLTDFFVTRERRATFRQTPGSHVLRPAAATQIPGLFLAGAWTDTGWPDTMEGAVRSGYEAATLAGKHLERIGVGVGGRP
jgi:hydroxysqualene dehydroxylase